jgi:hypothetical protein
VISRCRICDLDITAMSNGNQCLICKKCFMSPQSLDRHMHKRVPCEPKHHRRIVLLFDTFTLREIAALEEVRLRRIKKQTEHERVMEGIRIETEKIIADRIRLEAETAVLHQELIEMQRNNEALRVSPQLAPPIEA